MWTLSGFGDEIDPDLDRQCQLLDELGIGHLEVRRAWGTNVLDLDDDQLVAAKKILARHEISLSAVGSPIGKVGIHEDFDEHLRRFDRALHVAAEFGAPYLRLFSFYLPDGDDPAQHRDAVLRRMRAMVDRAAGHDVILVHENEARIYGEVPERCLDIVESVGSERLRLLWDGANYVSAGFRPFTDAYTLLRPYLAYVHVKDRVAAGKRTVPAGEGDAEISETVCALRDDGFEGFFSLEPHLATTGRTGGFSGPELFTKAARAFTALLDAHGVEYR